MNGFALAALALVAENLIGYPKFLQEKIGHPVQWIGLLVALLDQKLNQSGDKQSDGRLDGIAALGILIAAAGTLGLVLHTILAYIPGGWLVNLALATTLLAQQSLRKHVHDVKIALGVSIERAREDVSKIVGRDPNNLDDSGVAKAAIESLAENTSDGIVAPALWYAIAGLPGLFIYKAVNTADSMIGHKNEKYLHFGWASARFDDLINLPASRLTTLIFIAIAATRSTTLAKTTWKIMRRDAGKHQSPNAGWPEAAMAGTLGLSLGGPRQYEGETIELPYMGDGRKVISREDIENGLKVFDQSMLALASLLGAISFLI